LAAMSSTEVDRAFTLFPNLPVELRLKIWKATVIPRSLSYYSWVDIEGTSRGSITTIPYTPAILHVSGEAREIGTSNCLNSGMIVATCKL